MCSAVVPSSPQSAPPPDTRATIQQPLHWVDPTNYEDGASLTASSCAACRRRPSHRHPWRVAGKVDDIGGRCTILSSVCRTRLSLAFRAGCRSLRSLARAAHRHCRWPPRVTVPHTRRCPIASGRRVSGACSSMRSKPTGTSAYTPISRPSIALNHGYGYGYITGPVPATLTAFSRALNRWSAILR